MNTHDIISRALSVIEESDGADEHAELITELRALVASLAQNSATVDLLLEPELQLPDCDVCDNGQRFPDDRYRRLTFEGNSVQMFCNICGRCLQA